MNRPLQLLAVTALIALAPGAALAQGAPAAGAKKLYCWNENGRRVCGDALPATAVDAARTEISARSGLKTGEVARALTDAEREAAAAQADADRQAAMSAEAIARREQAMVESYASEAELRRAFNARIELLDGTVKASQLSVGGLRQSLLSLLRRAGESELAGKPVAKALADNIRLQHAELLRQQAMLAQQRADRVEIDAELARAIERYRALKRTATAETGTTQG